MRVETQKRVAVAIVGAVFSLGFALKWASRPQDYTDALRFAVTRGDLAETERLLNKGADPNPVPSVGKEPLLQHVLIFGGANSRDMLALLLKHGADPNGTLSDGSSLWVHAAHFRKLTPETIYLFADAGADFNRKSKEGSTILHFATHPAGFASKAVIEALLESGADPNSQQKDGLTALHYAVDRYTGDAVDVTKLLLAYGGDPSIKDNAGLTPLARYRFSKEGIILALVEGGADVSIPNGLGQLPLMTVSSRNMQQAALLMLEKGAEPDIEDEWGQTPLSMAAANGYMAVAKALVEKGADVNHTSKSGSTPLHAAAARSQKEMVDYLISRGARIDAKDNKGLTPIDYAEGRNAPAEIQKRKSDTIDLLSKPQGAQ
jgi:cytohesin